MTVRVLIVNDSPLYREGLAHVLGKFENISVVGAVSHPGEILEQAADFQPDVILVQLTVSQGPSALRAFVDAAPKAKVIALGVPDAEKTIIACAEAGAAGYLLQHESLDDLVATVERAARGEVSCSPRIAATLFRRIGELAAERGARAVEARLSPRELEIVDLIDRGLSNKEIALCLSIEVRTVKNHVHNILEKLQVRRRGEAAAWIRDRRPAIPQAPRVRTSPFSP
jgi:two-component system, NarL family, nitrate/nitrite response regulator NarL